MEQESNRVDQDTDNQHGDDGPDQQQEAPLSIGIARSISPGVPCPEIVLVAVMTERSYVLMSYPAG